MSPEELIFQAVAALLAGYIGWLSRGLAESFKTRGKTRAWKRARRFLPSDTSKN